MDIDEIIENIAELSEQSRTSLKENIKEVTYPKGHILLKSTRVEKNIYFIKRGIVRAYAPLKDDVITFWFGKEGDTVISMKSYVANEKSYETIELLEKCDLYELEIAGLQRLFSEDIAIANWGRRFAEKELLKTEERLISRQFKTALQRYKELMQDNPDLIKRVQLGHIAAYLGITQVSLSRVRAELK